MVPAVRLAVLTLLAWTAPVTTSAQMEPERRFTIPLGHLTPIPYGVTGIDLTGSGNYRDRVIRTRLSDPQGTGFQEDFYFAQELPSALTGPDNTDQALLIREPGPDSYRWPKSVLPEIAASTDWGINDVPDFGGCPGLEAWLARDPAHPAMPLHLVLAWYAPERGHTSAADRVVRFAILRLRDRFLYDLYLPLPGEPDYVPMIEPTFVPRVPPYPDPYPVTEEPAYDFVRAAQFTAGARYEPCRLAEALGAEMIRP
jgi:hypothetical protein